MKKPMKRLMNKKMKSRWASTMEILEIPGKGNER
jgi:hypothetical protein